MTLCSAPVNLFLGNYYAARGSACGLLEMVNEISPITYYDCNGKKIDEAEEKRLFYLHYTKCVEEEVKENYRTEMTFSYIPGSTKRYAMHRRIAALHNILGELNALSEFIKTTVDMNDQLLFRILMLFGSFLMLLGEFVWNAHLKHVYYD
jgi:hypothetical protein